LDFKSGVIKSAAVSLGSVAPTIIHASKAEQYLVGKSLIETNIHETAKIAMGECKPIDDMRGSADYRREMVKVCVSRSLTAIMNKKEDTDFPSDPVLLWGSNHKNHAGTEPGIHHNRQSVIKTTINGKSFSFSTGQDKTLLRLLREEAGLIGTKEGCAEGECGACTVFLDGMAVMACLVPAPRAHGAEIITIEGLAQDGKLHPVQEEFIRHGAVQCGYCTPGFIMSGAKLLEEREHPERSEIEQAITGNLCRCTGYYKILEAIEAAGQNPS
jgi:carbon-monoxide dehydrogenase medium subunit